MAETSQDPDVFWLDPKMRGILPLESLHISRKLRKMLRVGDSKVTFNQNFEKIIHACAGPSPARPETWINAGLSDVTIQLYHLGYAHSVEVWRHDQIIGGLYGIALGGAFFGESMVSLQPNASKIALVHLVARLKKAGYILLDTQFVTAHLQKLGAIEISRADYRQKLAMALNRNCSFLKDYQADECRRFLASYNPTAQNILGEKKPAKKDTIEQDFGMMRQRPASSDCYP